MEQGGYAILRGVVMLFQFSVVLAYSFVGFLLETAYAALRRRPLLARKCFLVFPLCPVYGLSAAVILALPDKVLAHPLLLFLAGGLLATLVEYAVSLFYELGAGVRFWDYSQQPGNLRGRVCPAFTLLWGGLTVALYHGLHPALLPLLEGLPQGLLLLLFPCLAVDGLLSLWLLHRTGSTDCLVWYRPQRKAAM